MNTLRQTRRGYGSRIGRWERDKKRMSFPSLSGFLSLGLDSISPRKGTDSLLAPNSPSTASAAAAKSLQSCPEKTGYWLRCLSFSPCVLPSSTKLSQDSSQGSCWSPRMRTEDHIAQSEHTFTSKSLLAKASHKSSPGLRNGEIDSLLNGKCCKFTLQRSVDGGLENCGHHRNH